MRGFTRRRMGIHAGSRGVVSAICGMGLKHFEKIGINDVFGQSGKPAALLEEYGLTGKQIADRIAKA